MRLRPRNGALVLVMGAMLVAGSAGFSTATTGQATATAPAVPKVYPSPLSPAQIAQLSANSSEKVIILLANQHGEVPGTAANTAARAKVLAAAQAPLLSELKSLSAPNLHAYSFLNAISATVSHAEAVRLAANPLVSAVVPDTTVTGPTTTPVVPAAAAAPATQKASPATVTAPAAGVCPATPTSPPLLEPEALSLIDTPANDTPDGVAGTGINGDGVKVAVFPDGLDPNIPDFIRQGGPDAGQSAIFDYQDFTGEGAGAQTGGEEAFGDASSLIAQGTETYDLSGEVNAAKAGLVTSPCNIRIQGVAPGASVAVMKVFGNSNLAFDSEILDGMEYAVETDHVDIMSQSFGGNPVPNTGTDPISIFDADAVAAGITVVVSSGDAGVSNTIGSPATNPAVISVGATTSYQIYAQTGSYGYGAVAGTSGWLSNEIGAFSSSGITEYGPDSIDVVGPGENNWADCSTNTAVFTECSDIYNGPHPQPIVAFGGTSESCPLTAATAALVIEAYRTTHGGATPAPAVVKQVIMSSSQDIDAPGNYQGAGLLDVTRAIQTAESIHDTNGSPAPTGQGLLYSPNTLASTGLPGTTTPKTVTVTNTSSASQTVSPTLRMLGPSTTVASGTLNLKQATDPTFTYQTGATVGDVHTVKFTVPAGVDRLLSQVSWLTDTQPSATIRATLFDPMGRMAATSRPQGSGGGYGEDEIHNPTAGQWTLLVFETVPYTGKLAYTESTANFVNVASGVVPPSRTIAAGATSSFVVEAKTPSSPGDLAESVVFTSAGNSGPPLGTIPLILRSTIPVHPSDPGTFNGTLTGGNARGALVQQELPYQFSVPAGITQLNAHITVGAPGYQVLAFLIDPNQSPVDVQSTLAQDQSANLQTVDLSWHDPVPGTWNLTLDQVGAIAGGFTNGNSSLLNSVPISGSIDFSAEPVSATGLPTSSATHLAGGTPVSATVSITNNGNSPELYSIDPRLNTSSTISAGALFVNPVNQPLPVSNPSLIPQFAVPPFSSEADIFAESTVPITFTTSPDFGSPEVLAGSFGNDALATAVAPDNDLPASVWSCGPNETGTALAVTTLFSCAGEVTTNTFDPTVASSTGNIWSLVEGLSGTYAPLELLPGQTGSIPVVITPSGASGTVVSGSLAVETFNGLTFSSDVLTTLPYTYKIS
jgi:Subtilase family